MIIMCEPSVGEVEALWVVEGEAEDMSGALEWVETVARDDRGREGVLE